STSELYTLSLHDALPIYFQAPSVPEFHLHPHYRAKLPLEATLLKTEAGLDVFITEKHAEEIAAILAQWSAGLLRSPQDIQAVKRSEEHTSELQSPYDLVC